MREKKKPWTDTTLLSSLDATWKGLKEKKKNKEKKGKGNGFYF
jgi:hypothetical protein